MSDIDYKRAFEFVRDFHKYELMEGFLDEFDKKSGKMVQSDAMKAFVAEARAIVPHAEDGVEADKLNRKLSEAQIDEAADAANNVINAQKMFRMKVAANGAARGLLAKVIAGDPEARALAEEFVRKEMGEIE
jgi:hypothetical protein